MSIFSSDGFSFEENISNNHCTAFQLENLSSKQVTALTKIGIEAARNIDKRSDKELDDSLEQANLIEIYEKMMVDAPIDETPLKKKNVLQRAIKISLLVSTSITMYWLAPPYFDMAARQLYPYIYSYLYGEIPSQLSPAYYFAYLPGKAHLGHLAYDYSWIITSTLGALSVASWQTLNIFRKWSDRNCWHNVTITIDDNSDSDSDSTNS